MFLSMRASEDQSSIVFSGVFSIVWIGEAVVTLQIKLLGGNMYVISYGSLDGVWFMVLMHAIQFILPISLHHRIHALSSGHCRPSQRTPSPDHRPDTGVFGPDRLVSGCGDQHSGWLGCCEEPSRHRSIPVVRVLHCYWVSLFHQLKEIREAMNGGSMESQANGLPSFLAALWNRAR